jgi:SAM-dependent methyltransferase
MDSNMRTAGLPLAVLTGFFSIALAQTAPPAAIPEVPYVPTTQAGVAEMLKLANVKKSDVVYDLGCGDGRIVVGAAKLYGAHAVGVDIDPRRIQEAKENARKAGVEDLVRFEEKDLFQADIRDATVVTLFLLSSVNQRLRPKLQQELKPGARIVSNTFSMGDWKPDREETLPDDPESPFSRRFYLWIVPERK